MPDKGVLSSVCPSPSQVLLGYTDRFKVAALPWPYAHRPVGDRRTSWAFVGQVASSQAGVKPSRPRMKRALQGVAGGTLVETASWAESFEGGVGPARKAEILNDTVFAPCPRVAL